MASTTLTSLEDRVTALEKELAELKAHSPTEKPANRLPWWEKIWGDFRNDPDYAEAMRMGREYREAQRPSDYTAGNASAAIDNQIDNQEAA